MNWYPLIPLGSLGRLEHLHIQRSPSLPNTHTRDEAHGIRHQSFKKLLKETDLLDVRFHDLRHGAATVLLAAKVDLKVVSALLGHSSISITADIYAYVLPEMQQEIVKKMDDLYGRS
jgi:integrase